MLRYAITDRRLLAPDEPTRRTDIVRQAAELASGGGVDFLQLREKDLAIGDLAALARDLRATLHAHAPDPTRRPRLLINSRADVALATRADGVHLTSHPGELTPADIRHLYRRAGLPTPTISLSCHTLADMARAIGRADLPDVILFGPVFEKRSGGELLSPGTGLDLLVEACRIAAPVPVLALGGVSADTIADCLACGAAGVAAIRLFVRSSS